MNQSTNKQTQPVNVQQNMSHENQPLKKGSYETPKLTRLGHLAQVTQKSGLAVDGTSTNFKN